MKRILLCLMFVTVCVSMNSNALSAVGGGKKKSVKELEAVLLQSEDRNKKLETRFVEIEKKYKELQSFVNSSSCSVRKEKTESAEISPPNCVCDAAPINQCSDLTEQNKSLRDTIRAQNEYLLNADNSGQISQKLIAENNENKSKAYYLEQASKSSAEEIKKLMVLNEALQRELAKYKGE